MNGLFKTYRVLAFVVGVLLLIGTFGAVLKYGFPDGGSLQQLGDDMTPVWVVHGWVFMIYVVVAFLLSRRAGWSWGFTVVALVAGLVPLLIFWVERRVVRKLEAENPDLVEVAHSEA